MGKNEKAESADELKPHGPLKCRVEEQNLFPLLNRINQRNIIQMEECVNHCLNGHQGTAHGSSLPEMARHEHHI